MAAEKLRDSGVRGNPPLRLVVGVLTYRRPATLARNLPIICARTREAVALVRRDGACMCAEVLVVDNDPSASARDVVRRLDLPGVQYVQEREPGIAAARNRAMCESAGADLLAFIDDDEEPLAGWLSSLVAQWRQSGAAGVVGRVVPAYASAPDPWIVAGEFFVRRTMPTGTARHAAAAGNLLLDLRQLAGIGIAFDEPFGLTGGEDTLLTRRMTAAGLRLVWCDESVVKDLVPSERLNRQWVLRRAWSHGNTQAMIDLHLAGSMFRRLRVRAACCLGGCLRIATGGAQVGRGLLRRSIRDRARGTRMVWRGAGVIAGAVGIAYEEYARALPRPEQRPVPDLPRGRAKGAPTG